MTLQQIEVGPLSPSEGPALAKAHLGDSFPNADQVGAAVAREAGGVPYFIEELARYMSGFRDADALGELSVSLEEVIARRLTSLAKEPHHVLELVATAGRPLPQATAFAAAGQGGEVWKSVATLTSQNLVRNHGRDRTDDIECYHDRIREVVTNRMTPDELRSNHLTLARALSDSGAADPELLFGHYLEGGEPLIALEHARKAADQALQAFAFDRAAELYQRCLELHPEDSTDRTALTLLLADSLSNAGRGPEAAEPYLRAAEGTPAEEARRWKQRAAGEYLGSGHLEQGRKLLHEVLADVGIKTPRTAMGATAAFLTLKARLAIRSYNFRSRTVASAKAETLEQIDLCFAAASGLGLADPLEGMVYQMRATLLALDGGDSGRAARCLALEAAFLSLFGKKQFRKAEGLLQVALDEGPKAADGRLQGLVEMIRAIMMLQTGRWEECLDAAAAALKHLRAQPTGVAWELATGEAYYLAALGFLGRLDEMQEMFDMLVVQCREKGDLHSESHLRLGLEINPHLIDDRPDDAEADIKDALARWGQRRFTLQHNYALHALAQVAMYRSNGATALALADELWRKLSRSPLRRVELIHNLALEVRNRSVLAALIQGGDRRRLLNRAAQGVRDLDARGTPWISAQGRLMSAQLALLSNSRESAAARFAEAADLFDATEMALHATAARWRLGELTDRRLRTTAEVWLAHQRVLRPEALVNMLVPVLDVGYHIAG